MKRKRKIATGEVYKYKACLCIDRSKQTQGVNYWETFAPVARSSTIRVLIPLMAAFGWCSQQIDNVLAFTQAQAETDSLYMEVPRGIENNNNKVYRILQNLYNQKQAGQVWNLHLAKQLIKVGFLQSVNDECLYIRGKVLYVLYMDDSIITAPEQNLVDKAIEDNKSTGSKLTIKDSVADFLGVIIKKLPHGIINMTQPHLIN